MSRRIQWLEFISPKERARREDRTRRRLMPLGDEQRTAELVLLHAVVHTRSDDMDLMFQLLQAKECLSPEDPDDAPEALDAVHEWLHSPLARRYPAIERAAFWALAAAEQSIQPFTCEALPSAQALLEQAQALVREHGELF